MNVTCPSCRTIYRVDPKKVPAAGVLAQCARCPQVFEVALVGAGPSPTQPVAPVETVPAQPEDAIEAGFAPPALPLPWGEESPEADASASEGELPPLISTDTDGVSHAAVTSSEVEGPAPASSAPEPSPDVSHFVAEPEAEAEVEEAAPADQAATSPEFDQGDQTESEGVSTGYGAADRPADSGVSSPRGEEVSQEPVLVAAAETAVAASLPPPPFGSSDPHQRARRLARALVSDMVVYHPDRRARGIRQGNLRQEFREEIKKSWEEYASQVGNQLARETSYFRDALNEILAEGVQLF